MAGPEITPTDINLNAGGYPLRRDAGTASYVKRYAGGGGGGGTTHNILRMRKHYWGAGTVHLRVHRYYYVGWDFGEYIAHGHTRSTHGAYQTVSAIHSGLYVPYWDTPVYPAGTNEGYVDLKVHMPQYFSIQVEITVCGTDICLSTEEGGTNDMYNSMYSGNSFYIY